MYKLLASLTLAISAVAAPAVALAQSTAPVTRAEVRADLVRLEHAGYSPAVNDDATYPADIQKAEAKVARQSGESDIGGAVQGTMKSGPAHRVAGKDACVGPADFCTPYFGS